ncbi:MAG TPA: HU family DNA-binding protein [Blastocatellia bacterium]|nr:HU family DNA-binding protein [Blastocatellia bacterium]
MTKAELVEEVARAAELNKRDAEVIVETVFDSIISALHKGEKVELRGFGSFRTRERGPRRGRNPKTGEPVDVPAKRVPYFKPGKELKEFFTESADGGEGAAGMDQPTSTSPASAPHEPQPSETVATESGVSGGGESGSTGEMAAEASPATSEATGGGSSSSGSAD